MLNNFQEIAKVIYVGCWMYIYVQLSQEVSRTIGGMPSLRVFLRETKPYLREIWRKLPKTPKGYVDKCDQELNPEPPVYQFWTQKPLRHWWGTGI